MKGDTTEPAIELRMADVEQAVANLIRERAEGLTPAQIIRLTVLGHVMHEYASTTPSDGLAEFVTDVIGAARPIAEWVEDGLYDERDDSPEGEARRWVEDYLGDQPGWLAVKAKLMAAEADPGVEYWPTPEWDLAKGERSVTYDHMPEIGDDGKRVPIREGVVEETPTFPPPTGDL